MRYPVDNERAISRVWGRVSNLDQTRPSEGKWVRRRRELLSASAASATLAGVFVGAVALPSAAGPGDWGITGDGKQKTTPTENMPDYDDSDKPKPKLETPEVTESAQTGPSNFRVGPDYGKGEIGQSSELLAENFDITAPTKPEWTNVVEHLASNDYVELAGLNRNGSTEHVTDYVSLPVEATDPYNVAAVPASPAVPTPPGSATDSSDLPNLDRLFSGPVTNLPKAAPEPDPVSSPPTDQSPVEWTREHPWTTGSYDAEGLGYIEIPSHLQGVGDITTDSYIGDRATNEFFSDAITRDANRNVLAEITSERNEDGVTVSATMSAYSPTGATLEIEFARRNPDGSLTIGYSDFRRDITSTDTYTKDGEFLYGRTNYPGGGRESHDEPSVFSAPHKQAYESYLKELEKAEATATEIGRQRSDQEWKEAFEEAKVRSGIELPKPRLVESLQFEQPSLLFPSALD